ncbi:MAG: hypothetical protein ABI303_01865 [Candidatus Saccharimonas sp.]
MPNTVLIVSADPSVKRKRAYGLGARIRRLHPVGGVTIRYISSTDLFDETLEGVDLIATDGTCMDGDGKKLYHTSFPRLFDAARVHNVPVIRWHPWRSTKHYAGVIMRMLPPAES